MNKQNILQVKQKCVFEKQFMVKSSLYNEKAYVDVQLWNNSTYVIMKTEKFENVNGENSLLIKRHMSRLDFRIPICTNNICYIG